MTTRHASRVALLLFGSGACALVYQVVWLRELRLVFGASSAATAAVLGIFMGGLGLGGAILGRRVDRMAKPLGYYSKLELSIAVIAAVTPFVIAGSRLAYLATGGSTSLGLVGATLLRLLLSTLVLGVPTFLMGGTLPAASRSVVSDEDRSRRNLAVLYGANTLGAVLGAFVSTFWMLEVFGTRNTLWLACAFNALIALKARDMSRSMPALEVTDGGQTEGDGGADTISTVPASFVYVAAGIVGFAFLLMELVWYRMLGPILGGTTYTFGLILVVALLGVGIGGGLYAFGREQVRPTLNLFTLTCALEALFIGLPFAFGDNIAVISGLLRSLGVLGFAGMLAGWFTVVMIVIFSAALIAGYQFPLLIGLLGEGRKDVGRHLGTAYAWNTAGAIVGSVFGGFVLLPFLTAPGSWRLVVWLLVLLALAGVSITFRFRPRLVTLLTTSAACAAAVAAVSFQGPSAVWRHSGIGAGRATLIGFDKNDLQRWANDTRRTLVWEAEGREMSVGLVANNGVAFFVNGKNDGNSKTDAPTQVGSGLISAVLHPEPRNALVVGLGTGSTSGWLAQIESIERVDSVELEPAIVEVARICTPVNAGVLSNPKSRILLADAREVLLADHQEYDLIVSEPSNPYRAGIASLYTIEFYRAVANRLRPGGIFTQWMQAYEVDSQTIRTVTATLGSVFPHVQVWQTNGVDMMFLCSKSDPGPIRIDRLRERLAQEPFRKAFAAAWGTHDAEGFLSHFVAGAPFTRTIIESESRVNTDDRMLVEFSFARTVGRKMAFNIGDLRSAAQELGFNRPDVAGGGVDWTAVDAGRAMMYALIHEIVPKSLRLGPDAEPARGLYQAILAEDLDRVSRIWAEGTFQPRFPFEIGVLASGLAEAADSEALEVIRWLEMWWPLESKSIACRYFWRIGEEDSAASQLIELFEELRTNPWIQSRFLVAALELTLEIAEDRPDFAPMLFEALVPDFAVAINNEERIQALLRISSVLGPEKEAAIFHTLEPNVPWDHNLLVRRLETYAATGDPLTESARRDLARFVAQAPEPFRHQ